MLPRSKWLLTRLFTNAQGGPSTALEAVRTISSSTTSLRLLHDPQPPQPPPGTLEGAEKPDLVARYLSLENAPRQEHTLGRLREVMAEYQRFKGDTGSTEVQVGLLTEKIRSLAEHLSQHRKDHSSRRGLQAMLAQRRTLLQYLRRTKFDTYAALITKLGLKDAPYAPQDRFSIRYKAIAPGGAASSAAGKRRG